MTEPIHLEPSEASSIRNKWGVALNAGFVVIPSALLRNQYKLGIDAGETVVLMNLLMSWWKSDDLPYPRTSTLAKRLGVSTRTAQRHIENLEEKRLIKRVWGTASRPGVRAVAKYDLTGIVEKLKELGSELHPARKSHTTFEL